MHIGYIHHDPLYECALGFLCSRNVIPILLLANSVTAPGGNEVLKGLETYFVTVLHPIRA